MKENKDFKVKLIVPTHINDFIHLRTSHVIQNPLPYGIGVLAAHLRQHNYYVELEDLRVRYNLFRYSLADTFAKNFKIFFPDESRNLNSCGKLEFIKSGKIKNSMVPFLDKILDSISAESFNLVGFSFFSSSQFGLAMMLSHRLKQRTNKKVVVGGPLISLYSQFYYPDIFGFVDYVITGDGRIPLLGLIQFLQGKNNLSKIPNLSYKENGKIFSNPRETYPLEDIPVPDFKGLPTSLYSRRKTKFSILPYQISRGCINRCSFCANMDVTGKLEFKSYDKVLRELKQMSEDYQCRKFLFCDDAINNSYEYLEGLCDLFIKHKLNIKWRVHARVSNLDKHILGKMKEAGCVTLALGVESGSERILKSMNKGYTIEHACKIFKDASEVGLKLTISLIAGYPGETEEDVKKTIDFIRQHRQEIDMAYVFAFRLRSKSSIYLHPDRYGVCNLSPLGNRPMHCAFDEVGGLTWKRKVKQIESSYNRILRAIYYFNPSFKKKGKFLVFKFLKVFRRLRGGSNTPKQGKAQQIANKQNSCNHE